MPWLLQRLMRRFVQTGTLTVRLADGATLRFGDGTPPACGFRLTDAAIARQIARAPEYWVPEAYASGRLIVEHGSLHDLLALYHRNQRALHAVPWVRALRGVTRALSPLNQFNPSGRARRNAAHHYDRSNAFYRLFLDEDLQYSCAYFAEPAMDLAAAQRAKKLHIAAKLGLRDGQRILDIGCGWGGLALTLAQLADVEVTGITLSEAQYALACERAAAAGLAARVTFRLLDYRAVEGSYDRIVSVGMFEHVGRPHYRAFFAAIRNRLTSDGLALLHAIGHHETPAATNPWIDEHIFPGGYAPSLSEVFEAVEPEDLWVTDVEILRLHYAKTLRAWQTNFTRNRAEIEAMMGAEFARRWWFYLVASEAEFRHGANFVFQMQLARSREAAPLTRDSIQSEERRMAARLAALEGRNGSGRQDAGRHAPQAAD